MCSVDRARGERGKRASDVLQLGRASCCRSRCPSRRRALTMPPQASMIWSGPRCACRRHGVRLGRPLRRSMIFDGACSEQRRPVGAARHFREGRGAADEVGLGKAAEGSGKKPGSKPSERPTEAAVPGRHPEGDGDLPGFDEHALVVELGLVLQAEEMDAVVAGRLCLPDRTRARTACSGWRSFPLSGIEPATTQRPQRMAAMRRSGFGPSRTASAMPRLAASPAGRVLGEHDGDRRPSGRGEMRLTASRTFCSGSMPEMIWQAEMRMVSKKGMSRPHIVADAF